VFCVRYETNLFLLAGMLCRESYHDSSSAVSRCISLRIPPASCNECRDRRFGGLYLLRVKVGRSPEMVDVRLRGQANYTPSPPPMFRFRRFVLYHFQYCHWLSATVCAMMSCRVCWTCYTGCSCVLIMLCRVVPYVVLFDGIHEMRTGEVWFVLQRKYM